MRIAQSRPWTGRTLLFALLAFFGVMVIANGIFVYFATESWTGLTTEDAYREGLSYNETLARAERQRALGWQSTLALVALDGNRARLSLLVRDSEGQAVASNAITALFRRPTQEGHDFEVVLAPTGDGAYAAEFALPLPGQWDVRVSITRADAESYLIETRLWPN